MTLMEVNGFQAAREGSVRTGVALDNKWLARPHLSFLADALPDNP